MAGNRAILTFGGDATALQKAAQQAVQATGQAAKAVDAAGTTMRDAAKSGGVLSGAFDKLVNVGGGLAGAATEISGSLQTMNDFMTRGDRKANEKMRTYGELEQATIDLDQAEIDLAQSERDLSQAMIDGKQAVLDGGQAIIDQKQARIDEQKAINDYTDAVKKYGKGSLEAKQAILDQEQAQQALKQAQLDGEQAAEAEKQATLDQAQAHTDGAQSQRDAVDANMEMADAIRELHPTDWQKWSSELGDYASVATAAVGTLGLLQAAYAAVNTSAIASAAGQAASKVATLATSAASGVATAAQWLWNAAQMASPTTWIVIAIVALIAVIVLIATKTDWFQKAWKACWGWIKDAYKTTSEWITEKLGAMWDWICGLPEKLGNAFKKIKDYLMAPFRAAFNWIADAWNSTVGGLHWTIPSWVPGVGGNSISAPKLKKFHTGGVVPGVGGQEMLAVLQAGERVIPSNQANTGPTIVIQADGTRTGDLLVALLRDAISVRGGTVQTILGGAL